MIIEQPLAFWAELAFKQHAEGRVAEAEDGYRKILAEDAAYADALHGLGILKWQQGELDTAYQNFIQATAAKPEVWRYFCTLGRFLAAVDRHEEAVEAFQRAVDLQSSSLEVWFDLAASMQVLERLEASVSIYRHLIELQADHLDAWNNLGVILDKLGQSQEAVVVLRQALAIGPQSLSIHNNLGYALLNIGRIDEAIAVLRQGLSIDANSVELWFNYANALAGLSASEAAVSAYEQVLRIDPKHVKALVNLGNVLRLRSDLNEALKCYQQAIALAPQYYDAYNNAGVTLNGLGLVDDAISMLRQATALEADISVAHNNLGNVFKDSGRLDAAIVCYRRALACDPNDLQAHSNLLYLLSFHPDYDAWKILQEAKQFAANHSAGLRTMTSWIAGLNKDSTRRLRIAYVSPDFRQHCQSLFTIPLFAHHDHSKFEVFCYAQLANSDEVSERLAGYADVWRLTYGQSDEQLAETIFADQIDILIDLSMHMANGRPLLFLRKPAPIQIAWLAYPGTTGLPTMDYRFTDPWLDPPDTNLSCYAENSLRLPKTFWCYDPLVTALKPNELPALVQGYVTFGCLNNFCKVSDETLCNWAEIMVRVAASKLILLAPVGRHRLRVYDLFSRYGIAAERIEFVEFSAREYYLKYYHRIDVCLDTLPYNGHTTSIDAYWMGVPVVTQVGATIVGRAGWSQLNNLGLSDLAAFDPQGFIDKAVALANDLNRLNLLRQTLRKRLLGSPLMDGASFARSVESIYRQLWEKWCLN